MTRTRDQILDELLVLQSQQGDSQSFEQLVERWQPRLWRHAMRLTQQGEAASDVVQESWMAIVRGLRRLDDPARFPAWAYRIVTNKCADWTRRQSRMRRAMQTAADFEATSQPSAEIEQDNMMAVRAALRELPPDRRAILSMLYQDGLSLEQIADALSIPIGTVKSRLHAARSELRNVLERITE